MRRTWRTAPPCWSAACSRWWSWRARPNTLVIGEVLRVRLSDAIPLVPGTLFADTAALRPVARLWGDLYATIGDMPALKRPAV